MSDQRMGHPSPEAPGHTCDPDGGPVYDLRCAACILMLQLLRDRDCEAARTEEREACIRDIDAERQFRRSDAVAASTCIERIRLRGRTGT